MAPKAWTLIGWTVVLASLSLVGLGWAVANFAPLLAWDRALCLGLHRYATPTATAIVARMTDLGTVWGVLPASLGLVALAFYRRAWWAGGYLIFTMAGMVLLTPLAKLLWHRARPALWPGVSPPSDFSFPSGHATYSLALVLALILLAGDHPKRPWMVGLGSLFVLLIGGSRVYLGVHYPSDVLGGWLLATAWAVGLYGLIRGLFVTECKTSPQNFRR